MTHQTEDLKNNSVGLALADTEWQDNHYGAMQPEYEDMLRWVGIQPGWKVLDAACGAGGFLPLMAELVGPAGEVHAIDLDPQVVEVVNQRFAKGNSLAPVSCASG
ncbi:MAG: methyltransferase domain-containing protein [Anaerolineae bacterium]|nr:methyltransferase domain-containing protein [Anaerolineae bacterium]